MAGSILVREVLARVSRLLQDISPQFINFREIEAIDCLNDATLAIAKFLPSAASRMDAIKLRPGTLQTIESIASADCKPGDGSTPSQTIRGVQLLGLRNNMGSSGTAPGKVIRVVDQKKMDAQDQDWHTSLAGTSVQVYTHDPVLPLYFEVWPPVHASTPVWVRAAFNAEPLKIPAGGAPGSELYKFDGSSAETIKVRDIFIDDLVNYVVARANMKDAEWADANKAVFFENLFLQSLNATVTAQSGVNPNLKRLPFAPAPMGQAA